MGAPKPEPVCSEPKVFVGQIPLEATQDAVFALFSKYGSIKKCAIITGPDGRSKGCAMVTFERWAEAELAVEHENGTSNLGGARTMLVKFADPPRGRGDGPVTGVAPKKLFVGQIPGSTTDVHVRNLFAPYGNIADIHVLNKGNAPGCAFVTYERWAQAEAAMMALNGQTVLEGATAPMVVKFADAKVMPHQQGQDPMGGQKRTFGTGGVDQFAPNKRTFTGGLPGGMGMGMTSSGMAYNPYAAAAAMGYDMSTMAAMGYGTMGMMGGMVRPGMQSGGSISSSNAVQGMQGAGSLGGMMTGMMGANAMAGMGMMGGLGGMMGGMKPAGLQEGPKAWKLFIGQVPFEANESDLWPIFSPLGNILELVVLRNQGKSKGCAFITYESRADADKAVRTLDGQVSVPSDPRGRLLTVKYANNAMGGNGGAAMAM